MSTTALDIPHNEIDLARTCVCAYSLVMKVIQTIQTTATDAGGNLTDDPVEIKYYEGDSLSSAMAAVVSAMSGESDKYFTIISVHVVY